MRNNYAYSVKQSLPSVGTTVASCVHIKARKGGGKSFQQREAANLKLPRNAAVLWDEANMSELGVVFVRLVWKRVCERLWHEALPNVLFQLPEEEEGPERLQGLHSRPGCYRNSV